MTQKYSTPCHSLLQEVDSVHSAIEKLLRNLDIYSSVDLLRDHPIYKYGMSKHEISSRTWNIRTLVGVIRASNQWFLRFQNIYFRFFFKIPFTKVKVIEYQQTQPSLSKYYLSCDGYFIDGSIKKMVEIRKTNFLLKNQQQKFL